MQLRAVISTSAASRLAAARHFLSTRHPSEEVVIVGASRGAADDFARAIARDAGATFGLTRFSFTELAARAAAAASAGERRACRRRTRGSKPSRRAPYSTPRARASSHISSRWRDARGFRVRSRGPFTSCGFRALARPTSRSAARPAATSRRSSRGLRTSSARRRWTTGPACSGSRPLRAGTIAFDGRGFRISCSTCRSTPRPNRSSSLRSSLVLRARSRPCRTTTSCRARVRAVRCRDDALRRRAIRRLGSVRICAVTCSSTSGRRRAARRRCSSVFGAGRGARGGRNRPPRARRSRARRAVRRDGRASAHAAAVSRAARARVRPRRRAGVFRIAARGVPIRRAARSSRCCRARSKDCRRSGSTSICRSARCRRWATSRDGVRSARRSSGTPTKRRSRIRRIAADAVDDRRHGRRGGRRRHAAVAVEVGRADRRVGGRRRPHARRRQARDGGDGWTGWRRITAYRIAELEREEPESARIARFERDLRNLAHLRQFALPIVDALAEWPDAATWGEWLERFSRAGASGRCGAPSASLQTLADLRPMAAVGPVALEEARDVLHDRLVTLDWDPPARRYGRLFVGTPHQARGRTFRVVFVPGLAERVVPQRPREDPLLLDGSRESIGRGARSAGRSRRAERLLLKIAIGAATERLYLSYPRLDVSGDARARAVVLRARRDARDHRTACPTTACSQPEAADEGGASLAWPAPADPDRAIDDLEHDLAMLKPLLDARDPASVQRARALSARSERGAAPIGDQPVGARARQPWSPGDGLIKVDARDPGRARREPAGRAAVLALGAAALRRLSLSVPARDDLPPRAVGRARAARADGSADARQPVSQGAGASSTVRCRRRRAAGRPRPLPAAAQTLDGVVDRVAAEYEEKLAPAIDRVWRDEIDELRRDLGIWVQEHCRRHEVAAGILRVQLRAERRGARSAQPAGSDTYRRAVRAARLGRSDRTSIADVERASRHRSQDGQEPLETGSGRRRRQRAAAGALQRGDRAGAGHARRSKADCSTRRLLAASPSTRCRSTTTRRAQGLQVLEIVDRAVEQGFLAAAPAERACTWCDFRPVCGPREEERAARKAQDRLADSRR